MWRIRDWNKHFEVSQSKRCLDVMRWVPIPNKQDGDGYTELLDHPNGAAHFGAWTAIVQLASKCKPRGTLVRDGSCGHDIQSLARITRIRMEVFTESIPRMLHIGWLEVISPSALGEVSERTPSTLHYITLQDRTEQEGVSADADDADGQLREWSRWWNALREEGLVSAGVNKERPSSAIRRAWKRCQRSSEVRELLAQRDALEDRIRKSTFCREGWFRLEKLLGAKNRDGELIVRKLLEGGYVSNRRGEAEGADKKLTEARERLRKEFSK